MELYAALGALAGIVILFVICYVQDRKPVNIGKPRILPYKIIMMVLIVAFLATAAHIIGLLTGVQIKPRTSKYG